MSPLPSLGKRPGISRAQWMTLAAGFLGWMFDGVEMGLFPLCARPALKEMMGPDAGPRIGAWMGIVTAMFLIGAALGGVVFGWLGDRIGRVKAMTAAVLVYSVFSALGAFAQEPWQLAVPRLLASFGMGGEWALGVALVMEAWPASSRPLMAGLIGAAANLGFLLIAAIGLGLASFVAVIGSGLHGFLPTTWADALLAHDGWRLLMLLGAAPAAVTLLMILFVPESESWQHAAATAPANRITDIFAPGVRNRALQAAMLASIALIGTWCSVQQIPPWANKMAAAQHLNPLVTSSYAQIASGLGACVGSILGALAAQWLNRRQAYFIMALLSLLSSAVLFRLPQEFGWSFLVWVFIVGGVTASFFGWLPLYLPELFPTRIRATATGFAFNSGRFVAAGAALASGQLLAAFGEDYQRMCSVISLVYILGLIAIWFCPETKGKDLPA
jgi:MFS transporter, SHS family, sialic acid transporter